MFTSPLLSKSRFIRKSGKVCRPQRHTPRTAQHLIMLMVALIANFALTAAVSVRNIEFSQDTCSPMFSSIRGGKVTTIPERFNTIIGTLGKSTSRDAIEALLPSIIRDAIEVVQFPKNVFGKRRWFCANNRRLLLYKMVSEHYKIDFVPPQAPVFSFPKTTSKRIRDAKQAFIRKYRHEFTANADSQDACHSIQLRLRSGSDPCEKEAEDRICKIPSFRKVCPPDLESDTSSEDSEMTVKDEASLKSPSGKSKQKSTSMAVDVDVLDKIDDKYSNWDGFMRRRLNALLELTAK